MCAIFPSELQVMTGENGVMSMVVLWQPLCVCVRAFFICYYFFQAEVRVPQCLCEHLGDSCFKKRFFTAVDTLLQNTYVKNKNSSIVLLCHSMGCPVVHRYLANKTVMWKKKYIKHVIALGAPFAGSILALPAWIQG